MSERRKLTSEELQALLHDDEPAPAPQSQRPVRRPFYDEAQFQRDFTMFSPPAQQRQSPPNTQSLLGGRNPHQIGAAPHLDHQVETSPQVSVGSDKKFSFGDVRKNLLSKRYVRIGIGTSALTLVLFGGATSVSKATGESVATHVIHMVGGEKTNDMTFDLLDCAEPPVISANVTQNADYITNYKQVIVSEDELKNLKANKNYKPQRLDSFDDGTWAAKSQATKKPAAIKPFVVDKPIGRLPQTVMTGKIELGVCNVGQMSDALVIDGNRIKIVADKFALSYDQGGDVNKKALVAYEKFAPKAPGKANAGYISDAEFNRVRAIVVPNEKDPAVNNPKIDALIKASTLDSLTKDVSCRSALQKAGMKYIESYLQSKYPQRDLEFSTQAGAINSPGQRYRDSNPLEPDVMLIDKTKKTVCSDVTFKGVEKENAQ